MRQACFGEHGVCQVNNLQTRTALATCDAASPERTMNSFMAVFVDGNTSTAQPVIYAIKFVQPRNLRVTISVLCPGDRS